MTQEQINGNNAMIAIFDGKTPGEMRFNERNGTYGYHSDWNELMRVVEKIESICHSEITHKIAGWHVCTFTTLSGYITAKAPTKIASVYAAVCDFIRWHNEQEGEK